METLKIAFTSYLYPTIFKGGAANYAYELTKALGELGEDVTLFVPKKDDSVKKIKSAEIKTTRILPSIYFAYKLRNIKGYDIIHCCGAEGLFMKSIDVQSFYHYPKGEEFYIYLNYLLARQCIKKSKLLIAIENESKKELMHYEKIPEEKIKEIPLGINTEKFKPRDKHECRKRMGIECEKLMLFVGNLIERKNPLILIDILKETEKGTHLLIVGDGPLKTSIIKKARNIGVIDRIAFKPKTLPEYYNAADVFIFPSLQEGFGLVYLEAVASGLPFVSMNTGVAPKLKKFGLISESNEEFIKNSLKMIRNPIKIDNAYNFVKKEYSWKKTALQTIKAYKQLLP